MSTDNKLYKIRHATKNQVMFTGKGGFSNNFGKGESKHKLDLKNSKSKALSKAKK